MSVLLLGLPPHGSWQCAKIGIFPRNAHALVAMRHYKPRRSTFRIAPRYYKNRDAARHVATNAGEPVGVFANGAAALGRALEGGRATFGPPLPRSR